VRDAVNARWLIGVYGFVSNTLYSLCLTGDFVTQSAALTFFFDRGSRNVTSRYWQRVLSSFFLTGGVVTSRRVGSVTWPYTRIGCLGLGCKKFSFFQGPFRP